MGGISEIEEVEEREEESEDEDDEVREDKEMSSAEEISDWKGRDGGTTEVVAGKGNTRAERG